MKEHKRLYKEMVAEHSQHELHWRMEVWKWDQGNEALIRKYDSMFATKQVSRLTEILTGLDIFD